LDGLQVPVVLAPGLDLPTETAGLL